MSGLWSHKLLATLYLCLFLPLTLQSEPTCEYANIQVTNQDGSRQVFTVKHLQPLTATCKNCASGQPSSVESLRNPANNINTAGSVSHGSASFASPGPRSTDLAPTITILVGEILEGCDDRDAEGGPSDVCREIQRLASSCPSQGEDLEAHQTLIQKYADIIVDKNLLPISTGVDPLDRNIAYGLVLIIVGLSQDAVEHFSDLIEINPEVIACYHGRGMAYARLGLQDENAFRALADFSTAIDLDPSRADSYERRAEILLPMGKNDEALQDINKAIKIKPSARAYFLKGTIQFTNDDLLGAEKEFRGALHEEENMPSIHALYNLALTLYYRGKIRNAIEVFRDVIKAKPDYIDAHTSLGHAYRELGEYKKALNSFNTSLTLNENHILTLQLKGSLYYYSGQPDLATNQYNHCLQLAPRNKVCLYMHGLCATSMGSYYEGVKAEAKVIAYNEQPIIMMSPEFVKAHYLKEFARYLHHKLESPVTEMDLERDFGGMFRDHWAKLLPLRMEIYTEQPGIQPKIKDVFPQDFSQYSPEIQELLCKARNIGQLTQATTDGFLPNGRLNMAMGLAAIHIGQNMEQAFKEGKFNKSGKPKWRDIFNLAVSYRRLVDPEQPVLWLDQMPEEFLKEGYNSDIYFIRGHTVNIRLMQYFDLVFKLVKTMIEHYNGDASLQHSKIKEELQRANTYEDLITIARKKKLNQQGFMLSTQVPSMKDKLNTRHEGVILTLTGDVTGRVIFAINVATTKSRTASYHTELDHLYNEILREVSKAGVNKIVDVESTLNLILSFVYYFYNLMPLSRGSSVVAYSVAMGMFMAIGREVTGKLPHGKLVEMEAMLSGAPDAFTLVSKQWMNIKKMSSPLSNYEQVSEALPTIRHIIEVLNLGSMNC